MAFLDKSLLQSKANGMSFEAHPILKNGDVPENVTTTYLSGCVFATLMDDGVVSENKRNEICKIGHALQMSQATINECIANVSGLTAQEDKVACLDEIVSTLTDNSWRCYFMIDLEVLLCLNGAPNADGYEVLDYLGKGLFKKEDWRRDVLEFESPFITEDRARRYLIAAEKSGKGVDCRCAGHMFWKGLGVGKDEKQAFNQFQKGAELGDVVSQRQVGICYIGGRGISANKKLGVKWLAIAAEKGDVGAEWLLGIAYRNGEGVPKDSEKAVLWLKRAADAGDAGAQNDLAECYQNGNGIAKDVRMAFLLFLKAAEQGNAKAMCYVACAYKDGCGTDENPDKAFEFMCRAAETDPAYYHFLAGYYDEGIGVQKNIREAADCYLKCINNCNNEELRTDAQFQLGLLYFRNDSSICNDFKAFKWFKQAADKGYANAQYAVGLCYEGGSGVPQDLDAAIEWHRKSAAQGCEDAKKRLEDLADYISIKEEDEAMQRKPKGFFESLFS